VALLPGYVARGALRAGRLREVLPDYPLQEEWFTAHVPARFSRLARMETLLEWLAARLGQACDGWSG
jgi:DNA-binding transcriptional LysR family regulator